MQDKETDAAIREYLEGRRKLRARECNDEDDFKLNLHQTSDLRKLRNMWLCSFASSLERRRDIEARMRAVILEIESDDIPDWFDDFLRNDDWVLDPIADTFYEKAVEIIQDLAQGRNPKCTLAYAI